MGREAISEKELAKMEKLIKDSHWTQFSWRVTQDGTTAVYDVSCSYQQLFNIGYRTRSIELFRTQNCSQTLQK